MLTEWLVSGAGVVVGGGAGWFLRMRYPAATPAVLPLEAEVTPPVGTDQFQIVLSTGNGARARKIFERAEVAPRESVALWDSGERRGVRVGPTLSA
jgi:hypothetical protein